MGDRLRGIRMERGLKQQELAGILKVSRTRLSKWELGQAMPPQAISLKIESISMSPNPLTARQPNIG